MAKGSYRVRCQIDERKIFDYIKNKVDKALNNEEYKYEKNFLVAELSDPYVPYKTGALASNVNVTPIGIRYLQPYAHYQYVNVLNHPREGAVHPLATDHWYAAMMRDRREEFLLELQELIKEYSK